MPYYPQTSTGVATGRTAKEGRIVTSGNDLKLVRFDGYQLNINGVNQDIPLAGALLAAAGLSVGSFLYIYAYMNAGVLTLEASSTSFALQVATGMMVKNG